MLNLNKSNKIAVIGAAGSSGLAALNGLQYLANCTIKGLEQKALFRRNIMDDSEGVLCLA